MLKIQPAEEVEEELVKNYWYSFLPQDGLVGVAQAGDALVVGMTESHHPRPLSLSVAVKVSLNLPACRVPGPEPTEDVFPPNWSQSLSLSLSLSLSSLALRYKDSDLSSEILLERLRHRTTIITARPPPCHLQQVKAERWNYQKQSRPIKGR